MTSSNGIPAGLEQRGVCNRPAGGGRHAHDLSFTRFGASHLAADQRAVSPVCAGPTEQISPCRSGAISKDPGSHNVVSSRLDVCRQPSLDWLRGLFLPEGGDGRALNFGLTQRELGGNSLRQCPERLPCVGLLHPQKMEQTHGEIAADKYAYRRRSA